MSTPGATRSTAPAIARRPGWRRSRGATPCRRRRRRGRRAPARPSSGGSCSTSGGRRSRSGRSSPPCPWMPSGDGADGGVGSPPAGADLAGRNGACSFPGDLGSACACVSSSAREEGEKVQDRAAPCPRPRARGIAPGIHGDPPVRRRGCPAPHRLLERCRQTRAFGTRIPGVREGLRYGMVNFSTVARDCGVSSPTVTEYVHILEETLLGRFVPSFTRWPKRRVIRAPKFNALTLARNRCSPWRDPAPRGLG